jgi:citronellol/citronellal dehydrogenase
MFKAGIFKGKIALVSGGGSGIGFEIARQLLEYGAEVYISSRKAERLEAAAEQLREYGTCHTFALDIREVERVEELAEFIKGKSGRLDLLVNNAGGQFPSPAEGISPKGWQAVINTNLNGTWYMTQTMANHFFLPQQSGSIVNIIVDHYRGIPGMAHTAAARAGVDNLTKSLAIEWANRKVRINSIAPGIIKSSGLEHYPPELVAQVSKTIPMKRLGTTAEIAEAVLFIALSEYITGETLYVDGGSRLWGDVWQIE